MGVNVVGDKDQAALYCNTSMQAFGPVHISSKRYRDAKREMRDFLAWLDDDPRRLEREALSDRYQEWKEAEIP